MRAVVEAAGDVARVFCANDAEDRSTSLLEAMDDADEEEQISLQALAARLGPSVASSANGGGGTAAFTKRLGDGQLDVELLLCQLGDCEGRAASLLSIANQFETERKAARDAAQAQFQASRADYDSRSMERQHAMIITVQAAVALQGEEMHRELQGMANEGVK